MVIRHDVRTRMYLGGTWRDITDQVRQTPPIAIEHGRTGAGVVADTNPCTCDLRLDNTSGDWSVRNPMGPWFGVLGRNNPIEVLRRSVLDTFGRTLPSTWGSADTGQAWTLAGTVTVVNAVGAGVGTVRVQAATDFSINFLSAVRQSRVDVTADVTLPVTDITGGSVFPANLIVRGVSTVDFVYARVEILTDESIMIGIRTAAGAVLAASVVVAGLVHTSAAGLSVRVQAEDETVRAKVWHTASGEPLDWHVRADGVPSVPGWVGVRSALASGNSNGPLTFSYPEFAAGSPRFSGEVAGITTTSEDASNKVRSASVDAAGVLRRLSQGKAPVRSATVAHVANAVSNVVAFWPLDEGSSSTEGAAVVGAYPMAPQQNDAIPPVGAVKWGAATDLTGLVAAPEMTAGGRIESRVDAPATLANDWSIDWGQRWDPAAGAQNFFWTTSGLFTVAMTIFTNGTTEVYLTTTGPGSVTVLSFNQPTETLADWHHYGLTVVKNGATLSDFYINFDGSTVSSASGVAGVFAPLDRVRFSSPSGTTGPMSVSSVVVYGNQPSGILSAHPNLYSAFFGWLGEPAVGRMRRLCDENGVPFYWSGSAVNSAQMGAQPIGTLVGLLRQCAKADMGSLYEPRGTLGIAYRTLPSTYAQTAALTLDVANTELAHPFQPVTDDLHTRNDVTAKRDGGGRYRAVLTSGRLSVQPPPAGAGTCDTEYPVNVFADDQLPDIAHWQLALGTVDEPRWPDLGVDLDSPASAPLIPSVLDLRIDDRVVITNADSVGIYDDVDQIARGTRETWTNHRGRFRINSSPGAPYAVAVLNATATRLDSGSSSLTAGVNSAVGSLSVTTTDPFDLWSLVGPFPYDITIGGEVMSVTNITGATSPQTFTVMRSINGVVKSHSTGAAVHVLRPFRLAL